MAKHRLMCAPLCVYTALCVNRQTLICRNLFHSTDDYLRSKRDPAPALFFSNNYTRAVGTNRLLCAPLYVRAAKSCFALARFA